MNAFRSLTSKAILLPVDNIDTDQIIPARFLKTTHKEGLGKQLFADWRYQPDGSPKPDFPLNDVRFEGAQILVAGDNFGCGSSREHAPWALLDFGFRAVISTRFADIFRNNCLKNGLLPVEIDPQMHSELMGELRAAPDAPMTIDLERQQIALPNGKMATFPIDTFSKNRLLKGMDELDYLLSFEAQIAAYEAARPVYDR
ncbi:MAG: 3-isopropylmalate dehydratase small subunit [Anaerolineales bacterium]|nr:3-isopropylmalate dehydratase small subunit [Anaerolineales bacterium]